MAVRGTLHRRKVLLRQTGERGYALEQYRRRSVGATSWYLTSDAARTIHRRRGASLPGNCRGKPGTYPAAFAALSARTNTLCSWNRSPHITGHLNDRFYGRLLIGSDPARPTQPILPMARMQRIALNCASILYSLETAAYFQIEYPALPVEQSRPLTRRQREVLDLLCRHFDRKTIAEMLHISPGTVEKAIEFIYKKFGVHSEREAVAAAFALGLFFPVEHLSATIAPSSGLRETPAIE